MKKQNIALAKARVSQLTENRINMRELRLNESLELDEKKKLDPVDQEDADIDNDGDTDETDSYLLNRRKVRRKAIKNAMMEKEEVDLDEATIDYKVNVEGLPPMFIDAKNPNEVKMKLRKLLRRPDSIGDVTRITKADLKKYFRTKGMGKDPEAME